MEKGLPYVVVLSLLNIQKFNLQDTLALRVVNKEFEHNIKYKIKHRHGLLPWENIKTFLRKKCKLQYNMGKALTEIDLEDQTINDERILSLCKILKENAMSVKGKASDAAKSAANKANEARNNVRAAAAHSACIGVNDELVEAQHKLLKVQARIVRLEAKQNECM